MVKTWTLGNVSIAAASRRSGPRAPGFKAANRGMRIYTSRRMAGLTDYKRKRNFSATPEPKGHVQKSALPIFVVQRHAATHLHFDFRVEVNGALASWAVP